MCVCAEMSAYGWGAFRGKKKVVDAAACDKGLISLETAYVKHLHDLSKTVPSRDVICPERVKEIFILFVFLGGVMGFCLC